MSNEENGTAEVPLVQNPLAQGRGAVSGGVAAAEAQRAIESVQAALVIAQKFPRDPVKALDRIINACTRPSLAETAQYSYPRGGTDVVGPSIRLAEVLAQNWGNLDFGIRELEQTKDGAIGISEVEAYCWDLETNVRRAVTFQVPHVRRARGANNMLTDPRDIYELVANQGARRLRAAILAVIPGDVTEAALHQCSVTLETTADTSAENVGKLLDAFASIGVTQKMVEQRLGRRAEAIRAAQVVELRRIFQGIRDGISKPEDFFDSVDAAQEGAAAPESNSDALKNQLKGKKGAPAESAQEGPGEAESPETAQDVDEPPASEAESDAEQDLGWKVDDNGNRWTRESLGLLKVPEVVKVVQAFGLTPAKGQGATETNRAAILDHLDFIDPLDD